MFFVVSAFVTTCRKSTNTESNTVAITVILVVLYYFCLYVHFNCTYIALTQQNAGNYEYFVLVWVGVGSRLVPNN